jgi:surface antigen
MARRDGGGKLRHLGTALALCATVAIPEASAHHAVSRSAGAHVSRVAFGHHARRVYAGLQCVPFARNVSGIEIGGNAWTWWDQASGVYERGAKPEAGSVLAFEANGRMRLGHVAVVTDVINPREIAVDHANWGGRGGINREMRVVDVSEANDWTAVRLEMGDKGDFGSIYPTYGFIYDRPDHGTMVAAAAAAPAPALNPPPADLRPAERAYDEEEVAELPEHGRRFHGRHAPRRLAAHHASHGRRLASR